MVCANSTDACEAVTEELRRQGLRATAFHAEVSTADRADRLRALAEGEAEVLVCTDSAARGVDVPGVTHVIQAEFAGNAVDYLHRIGRTARCGAEGRVTNLFGETNEELIRAVRDAESRGNPSRARFRGSVRFAKSSKSTDRREPRRKTESDERNECAWVIQPVERCLGRRTRVRDGDATRPSYITSRAPNGSPSTARSASLSSVRDLLITPSSRLCTCS